MYIIYVYIYIEKINKLQVHPYKPVSWLFTHQGDLRRINFTIDYIQYNLFNLCSAKLTSQLLHRRALFLWRQEDTSSLRLFSVDSSGRQMIRNFSLRQRLHLLLELLYGECDERMRQSQIFFQQPRQETQYRPQ